MNGLNGLNECRVTKQWSKPYKLMLHIRRPWWPPMKVDKHIGIEQSERDNIHHQSNWWLEMNEWNHNDYHRHHHHVQIEFQPNRILNRNWNRFLNSNSFGSVDVDDLISRWYQFHQSRLHGNSRFRWASGGVGLSVWSPICCFVVWVWKRFWKRRWEEQLTPNLTSQSSIPIQAWAWKRASLREAGGREKGVWGRSGVRRNEKGHGEKLPTLEGPRDSVSWEVVWIQNWAGATSQKMTGASRDSRLRNGLGYKTMRPVRGIRINPSWISEIDSDSFTSVVCVEWVVKWNCVPYR